MEAKETVMQWIDFPALLRKADQSMKACEAGSEHWSYWADVKAQVVEIFNKAKQEPTTSSLPTDEEIDIYVFKNSGSYPTTSSAMRDTAKWMRSKLKSQWVDDNTNIVLDNKHEVDTRIGHDLPLAISKFLTWYKSKQAVNAFNECKDSYVVEEYFKSLPESPNK